MLALPAEASVALTCRTAAWLAGMGQMGGLACGRRQKGRIRPVAATSKSADSAAAQDRPNARPRAGYLTWRHCHAIESTIVPM